MALLSLLQAELSRYFVYLLEDIDGNAANIYDAISVLNIGPFPQGTKFTSVSIELEDLQFKVYGHGARYARKSFRKDGTQVPTEDRDSDAETFNQEESIYTDIIFDLTPYFQFHLQFQMNLVSQ